jgi:hypothetical protein
MTPLFLRQIGSVNQCFIIGLQAKKVEGVLLLVLYRRMFKFILLFSFFVDSEEIQSIITNIITQIQSCTVIIYIYTVVVFLVYIYIVKLVPHSPTPPHPTWLSSLTVLAFHHCCSVDDCPTARAPVQYIE